MTELCYTLSYNYGSNEYRVALLDDRYNTIWLCKLTNYRD